MNTGHCGICSREYAWFDNNNSDCPRCSNEILELRRQNEKLLAVAKEADAYLNAVVALEAFDDTSVDAYAPRQVGSETRKPEDREPLFMAVVNARNALDEALLKLGGTK